MKYLLFFLVVCSTTAYSQKFDMFLYTLKGDTIRAKCGLLCEISQDFIRVKAGGKEKEFKADSLTGFKYYNTVYFSLKGRDEPHYRFCLKTRSFDELEIYGWKDVAHTSSTAYANSSETIDIYRYDYVKRPRDDRSAVFSFTKEGLAEIPFLNCSRVMD